jgi:uncharacterized protein
MEWTWTHALLATAFVASGALLQSVTGLGAGLIIVPLLALLSVELIPGPTIFASLALSISMMVAGRDHIDFANTKSIIVGLLLGTALASLYISRLPFDALGIVFGVLILVAIAISLKAPRFALNAKGSVAAGALSGFMGTSAGVGAPVLALVFQHYPGDQLRATLAYLYVVSSITMLAFLNLAGRFGIDEAISGMILVPGFLLGYVLAPKLISIIDRGYARPAVLIVSTISACLLIWRSVTILLAH